MIAVWSASAAHALREAMRMSIDDFAGHLGVSRRGVASWSNRGGARLRWDVQRKLDDALAAAPEGVRQRLALLLDPQLPPSTENPAPEDETLALLLGEHRPWWPDATRRPRQRPAAGAMPVAEFATSSPSPAVAKPSAASPALGPEALRKEALASLSDLLLPPPRPSGRRSPPLIRLELEVARVWMAFQAARYRAVVAELPGLAQSLADAADDAQARFPLRVKRLTAAVHQITAALLLKLGELPLAMLAAERGAGEARASGDPLVVAASARCTVQALQRCGHHERSLASAQAAAQELSHATGLDGPRPLSAHGALLLSAALAAAHAGDRAVAAHLLADAARAAKTLGAERNFGWTAFGPSNVSLHRLGILLELAEPAAALQVSAAIDPSAILLPERLAAYHVDSARAFQAVAQPAAAVSALKKAYAVAPDEVRMRPETRMLATELARAARGPAKARAARFAEQVLNP